jgi:single-stranded DNA-binding protein
MNCNVATEVKYYANQEKGTQVAHFNVAYNSGREQEAMFFQTTLFGKNAETASKYVKVGMPLLLRCQLKPVTYDKKTENVRVQTFE